MLKQILAFVCSTSVVSSSCVWAAVILSDPFNYPDGVLQSVSSGKWVGHSGATNQVDVTRGALNLTGSESQDVHALLSGQPYTVTNAAALYTSFDLKFTGLPSASGSYFAHFNDAGSAFRGRIWALTNGAASGSFRIGTSSASGSAPSAVLAQDLKPGTEYKIVTRLGLSDAVATLWINPTAESDPSVSSDSGTTVAIASYSFRQAAGIGTMTIDNVTIGTSFADVVPPSEPPPPITLPPAFVVQPESQTVLAGHDVTFRAEAQGATPLSYQWQFLDSDLSGATNTFLIISHVKPGQQGDYRVVARNPAGMATSAGARLTVIDPDSPAITSQPVSLRVQVGETADFFVTATGGAPLRYQWRFNDAEIAGATSSTLSLSNVAASQAGGYRVTVGNASGSVESETATLQVETRAPVVRFTNFLDQVVCPGDLLTNQFTEHALRPGEKLTMRVTVLALDGLAAALVPASDGLPPSAEWTLAESSGTNLAAAFTYTPTADDQGTNFVVSLQVTRAGNITTKHWNFRVPTAEEQQLVLSEFLAHPATDNSAPHFNPLRRAQPAPHPGSDDQFVELVNAADKALDLSNWTISDATQVRHRFPPSFVLQAWGAIVVYGGPATGFPPALDGPAVWASENSAGLGLNDAPEDAIILRNAQGQLVSRTVYSALSQEGSLTRYPTLHDGFVPHTTVSIMPISPGTWHDGRRISEAVRSEPAPIVLSVTFEAPAAVALLWNAETGRNYSVFQSASLAGPFSAIATGLSFADKRGYYRITDWSDSAAMFFRVRTP